MKKLINQIQFFYKSISVISILSLFYCLATILTSVYLGEFTGNAASFSIENMGKVILIILAGYLGTMIFQFLYKAYQKQFGARAARELQKISAERICGAKMDWIKKQNTGETLGILQTELQMSVDLLSLTIPEILLQSMRILLYGACMFYLSWQLSLVFVGILLLVLILQMFISRPLEKASMESRKQVGKTNGVIQDIINQRKTVKLSDAGAEVEEWYQKAAERERKSILKAEWVSAPINMLGLVCGYLPIILLCLLGIVFIRQNVVTLTVFLIVYYLVNSITVDILHYTKLFSDYRTETASAVRLLSILEISQEDDKKENQRQGDTCLLPEELLIKVEGLNFNYGNTRILSQIQMEIHQGEKIAFVGESGSGKSTMANLLVGLNDLWEGEIYLKGRSYRELSIQELRSQVSMVTQKPYLFSGSVLENMELAVNENLKEVQLQEIFQTMGLAKLYENRKEEGLIRESGQNLSGGQVQRLGIARGLIRNPYLLILDEPSASLDAKTEQQIFDMLFQEKKDLAMLIITHRLFTISQADKIYVFQDGKIIDFGTHSYLRAHCEYYEKLWKIQSKEGRVC